MGRRRRREEGGVISDGFCSSADLLYLAVNGVGNWEGEECFCLFVSFLFFSCSFPVSTNYLLSSLLMDYGLLVDPVLSPDFSIFNLQYYYLYYLSVIGLL
jgi:hypothetical protein